MKKKATKKKSKDTRISTGIKNFDSMMEGGFEQDSINLVSGGPGAGKTILGMQYLLEGVKKGEPVLYITFKEKKTAFYKNMKDFKWDLEGLEKKGLFHFLEYSPIKVRNMIEEGGGTIETIMLTKKIKRVVIDSINDFILMFDNKLEKRESVVSLFNMLKEWKCTSVILFETDNSEKSYDVEFESDSLIHIHFKIKKDKRERLIEIIKMRGTKHDKELHALTIEKSGLEVSKKAFK